MFDLPVVLLDVLEDVDGFVEVGWLCHRKSSSVGERLLVSEADGIFEGFGGRLLDVENEGLGDALHAGAVPSENEYLGIVDFYSTGLGEE